MTVSVEARTTVIPVASDRLTVSPLDAAGVRVVGGFWDERLRVNRERTLPHGAEQLERAGNLANFRAAASGFGQYRSGADDAGLAYPFLDSDVYKWLEAAGWELARADDAALAARADKMIGLIAAAQRPDGYLNTYVQLERAEPFADLAWGHELYCVGHLVQAAVAWKRALGDERLLDVACRAADRVDAELGPSGRVRGLDGHPQIEMALVELYRSTGIERYLSLARHLIDLRGHGTIAPARFGPAYWQDHLPVREAPTVAGHAVRQLYLDCGAVDVAVETGDEVLLAAVVRRFNEMTATRTYLTGAVGSHHRDESFGAPYELPADRAYTETCAAIASCMLAWRLLLVTGEARYADRIEQTLLNAVLPAVSLEGASFFYVNPLHRRPGASVGAAGAATAERVGWYSCACCPPNVMRTLSSFEQLLATKDAGGIRLEQFADATVRVPERGVTLQVATDYPWEGAIGVTIEETPDDEWTLSLRVPGWCNSATLIVDGASHGRVEPGYAHVRRQWHPGTDVELRLEVSTRLTLPHHRIDAVRGCAAVERGPLVYCVEQIDLPEGVELEDAELVGLVDATAVDVNGLSVRALPLRLDLADKMPPPAWPYASAAGDTSQAKLATLPAIPYFAWGNRGAAGMRVWLPLRTRRCNAT